jgi:hypothetical protein
MRLPLALALSLIALLAWAPGAGAATLEVTTEAATGAGSLGETILEAGPGDTILVPPGEYLLTNGDVLLDQGNTIRGAGEEVTTIVPSGGGGAVSASNVEDATIDPPLKDEDGDSSIETKAQIVALIATLAIFLLVLDLVRRRRLAERYALLWMLAGVALLALAIWTSGLDLLADLMGIQEPANAIFILAFGVISVLLLHFSVAITRLSEETKILAQESARLEHELRVERGQTPAPGAVSAAATEQREDEPPVDPQPGE